MKTVLLRDLKLALRSGGHWLLGLIFFGLFMMLCGIALGGQSVTLRPLASALTWLAFIFAALLSVSQIFQSDMKDGSLAQLKLSGLSFAQYALAKLLGFTLISLLPMLLILPLTTQFFGLSQTAMTGLLLSLLIGLPAIAAYVGISGALLAGRQNSSLLSVLLAAPLIIPTLIFGIAAAQSYPQTGTGAPEWRILLGLSLIALAVALPAIIAALLANLE